MGRLWWLLISPALLLPTCAGCFGVFTLAVKAEKCRARQGEAWGNLEVIATAEKHFHDRFGRYTENVRELGFDAENLVRNNTYVLGFSSRGADGLILPNSPPRPVSESDLPAGLSAGQDHFRAGAAGYPNRRSDELDVWIIDETRKLEHPTNPCIWTAFHMFEGG